MWNQLWRVWVVASFLVLSGLAQGREAADRPEIIVLVNNLAGVEQATVLAAEETAAKTYAKAGVAVVWKNCLPQAEPGVDRCEPTAGPARLVVNIEHQTQMLTPDAYGVAFLDGDGRGEVCDIFYDRVLELHHSFPRASEAAALGTVVAHELGHLLLGLNSHSASGIMQPLWHYEDLITTTFGVITFNRDQVQKIHDRLQQMTLTERASQ